MSKSPYTLTDLARDYITAERIHDTCRIDNYLFARIEGFSGPIAVAIHRNKPQEIAYCSRDALRMCRHAHAVFLYWQESPQLFEPIPTLHLPLAELLALSIGDPVQLFSLLRQKRSQWTELPQSPLSETDFLKLLERLANATLPLREGGLAHLLRFAPPKLKEHHFVTFREIYLADLYTEVSLKDLSFRYLRIARLPVTQMLLEKHLFTLEAQEDLQKPSPRYRYRLLFALLIETYLRFGETNRIEDTYTYHPYSYLVADTLVELLHQHAYEPDKTLITKIKPYLADQALLQWIDSHQKRS